jgi:hypothetical protein
MSPLASSVNEFGEQKPATAPCTFEDGARSLLTKRELFCFEWYQLSILSSVRPKDLSISRQQLNNPFWTSRLRNKLPRFSTPRN